LRILVPTSFERREERLILVDGKRRKIKWTFCNSFEGMEVNKDGVGRLES